MKLESLLLLVGAVVLFIFLFLTVLFGPGLALFLTIIILFFGYLGHKLESWDYHNNHNNNNNNGRQ